MRQEQGFVLLQLLVTLAISAIMVIGGARTTVQILRVTEDSQNDSVTLREVQNLGYWVGQDLLQSMTASTADDVNTPDVEFIMLKWKDWQSGYVYDARYSWQDPASPLKTVSRKLTVYDDSGAEVSTASVLIAQHVYSSSLSVQPDGMWRLNVEARSGGRSTTRQYDIATRVG